MYSKSSVLASMIGYTQGIKERTLFRCQEKGEDFRASEKLLMFVLEKILPEIEYS